MYILSSMSMTEIQRAAAVFRKYGGILRTGQALSEGIHPRTLYRMRDEGILEQLSRGVYRLASMSDLEHPDLVTVSVRVPKAVVCLISALAYHEITTEIPHHVYLALPRGTKTPKIDHPPIRIFRFSGLALTEGVQVHDLGGVGVKIYGPVKTVVDCFRLRNKIGTSVAVEALNKCRDKFKSRPAEFLHFARMCRVEKVMLPYLEASQ
jgi:predicted transcriptional regulator of viral defense system